MALLSQIQSDLVQAMKEHDETKLTVLRMLKSAVQLAQVEKGKDAEFTDDDVLVLVRRLIKQRNEAAELYKSGGAEDRAAQELAEAKILEVYQPAQLSDAELEKIVAETAQSVNAAGPQDMGKVMGRAMAAVKGQADGNRVRQVVMKYLSSL